MTKRIAIRSARDLARVQHVRKAAAEAALTEARAAETNATLMRERAEGDAAAALEAWGRCLSSLAFDPDLACDLAGRLIAREAASGEAAAAHDAACERHERCRDAWRLGAARVDLADAALKDARRTAARVREERRLGAMSDAVTSAWMRR